MDIVYIGGVRLPPPTSFGVGMQDLDSPDSTRNEKGYLQRDMIREGMYRIELEFNMKTASEITKIESTLIGSSLPVRFQDAGRMISRTMYAGDRTKNMILNHSDSSQARWNLSFNLVEF